MATWLNGFGVSRSRDDDHVGFSWNHRLGGPDDYRLDDYRLSPVEHAELLRASAPKLAAVLTGTAPVELARLYTDAGH